MTLDVEWVDDPRRWSEFRERWDGIVEASERPSIFCTWDFLETCWLRFAPRGSRLAIVVFRESEQVIGFAPLLIVQRRRFGLAMRQLGLLASWEASRAPLIFPRGREGECARPLLACLEQRASEWDYLQINELDPATAFVEAVRAWTSTANGFKLVEKETSPSPYIVFDRDVDAWLAGLGASTRKSLRRYQRQLETAGRCELEAFEAPADMGRALDLYLDLESRSWKAKVSQGVGKDKRNRDFYRELLPRLANQRRVAVLFLTLDGRRIAANIELWLGLTAYCTQTTFDPEFARFSPGNVLQVMSLRWHAPRGITEYGLFGRFLENKLRFTRDSRPNVSLRVLQLRGLRRRVLFTPGLMKSTSKPAAPSAPAPDEDAAT